MPGYRSRTACVVLGEGSMTVDFVLDPETDAEGSQFSVDPGCYFESTSGVQVVGILPVPRLEIAAILILMFGFLCFLLTRGVRSNHLNQKETMTPVSKRAVV
ncbi:hypothetical protein OROGR_016313 [Orobanche gracilis]